MPRGYARAWTSASPRSRRPATAAAPGPASRPNPGSWTSPTPSPRPPAGRLIALGLRQAVQAAGQLEALLTRLRDNVS
jgi:hypothetical protein